MNSPSIPPARQLSDTGRPSPWLKNLPAALRGLGAAAVVFALYSFLVRGWVGGSDLARYFVLLGHTGLLAGIAFASHRCFRESKGPRLLLGLALVSVAANFAVLGAFLYAAVVRVAQPDYPGYLLWNGADLLTTAMMITGSLLVMVPVTALGFRTLARSIARPLSVLFLVSNSVLLIPIRDTWPTVILAMTCGCLVFLMSKSICRRRIEMSTREGMWAILLQFLPLAILLGRLLWLYDSDAVAVFSAAVLMFACLRQCTVLMEGDSALRCILEVGSVWVAGVAGCALRICLDGVAPHALALLSGCLLSSMLVYELSCRVARFGSGYRVIAGIVLGMGSLASLQFYDGVVDILLTLLSGVMLLALSVRWRTRSLFVAGAVIATASLLTLGRELMRRFDLGGWIALAIIGIAAIVLASALESREQRWQQILRAYIAGYRSWTL